VCTLFGYYADANPGSLQGGLDGLVFILGDLSMILLPAGGLAALALQRRARGGPLSNGQLNLMLGMTSVILIAIFIAGKLHVWETLAILFFFPGRI
jgi:hypothetical protein